MKRLTTSLLIAASTAAQADWSVKDACSSRERWNFENTLSTEWKERFERFTLGSSLPIEGFAQAYALREAATTQGQELLASYWLSQSLMKMGLEPMAYEAFSRILSQSTPDKFRVVQQAALECLLNMQSKNATLRLPSGVASLLSYLPKSALRSRAAYRWIMENPEAPKSNLNWIEEASVYRPASQALLDLRQASYESAAQNLDTYFAFKSHPGDMKQQDNFLRLLAGRSFFTTKDFLKSRTHFQLVEKNS
jgi:hypothetical protein